MGGVGVTVRSSSIDFDHSSKFVGFCVVFLLRPSSFEFVAVRSSSNPTIPPRRADDVIHRTDPFPPFCVFSREREIWCQSSIEFDRLRPFLLIHRLLCHFSAAPEFVRVRSSSVQFDRVRVFVLLLIFNSRAFQSVRGLQKQERTRTKKTQPIEPLS
jgi:hypothetical protein